MPAQCIHWTSATRCECRSDDITRACVFTSIPKGNRTRGKDGKSANEIKSYSRALLRACGYSGAVLATMMDEDRHTLCSCHFLSTQLTDDRKRIFGQLPFGNNTVQAPIQPTTPRPQARRLGAYGVPSPSDGEQGFLTPTPRTITSSSSRTRTPVVVSPEVKEIIAHAQEASDENASLRATNAALQQLLAKALADQGSLGHACATLQAILISERALTREHGLNATAPGHEGADPDSHRILSYHRAKWDVKFASQFLAMTGLPDYHAFELLWHIYMGFSRDVLPLSYRSDRDGPRSISGSTLSIGEHKNFLFFVMYYLRIGGASLDHQAMLFGFEKDKAHRWYVTWLNVHACFLARLHPQPNMDLIRRTSPKKWITLYKGRLAGILDCTEMKMQTPFEKMAQRATFSDYKSNNTIKYLVIISPAGATVYVSPGFPGRISDPQICHACAHFSGYVGEDEDVITMLQIEV